MPQVQSKYQNPDKFIEKLKDDLEWERGHKMAIFGKYQFPFAHGNDITIGVAFNSSIKCRGLFPGTTVRLTALVESIKRDSDGTEVEFKLDHCYLTEEF